MKKLKQCTNPLEGLPDESHTVADGKVKLNWPDRARQQFICPNCGITKRVRARETRRYSQEFESVYEFREGRYVLVGTIDHSMESAENDTLDAIVCEGCDEEIVASGQPAPRQKKKAGGEKRNG